MATTKIRPSVKSPTFKVNNDTMVTTTRVINGKTTNIVDWKLELGIVWSDYTCTITYLKDRFYPAGLASLNVGCAHLKSEKEARRRWRDGASTYSGARRPKAEALIKFAAAEFKKRGVKW